jgi:TnpA family transposase
LQRPLHRRVPARRPALTEARLKWVEANYLRADTITAANTRLVDHQAGIPLAQQWGGGELTSADGLRFVVPVRSIHAGPNPRYFGTGRRITLFNYVADNYLGWASIVVTGTARDSQFLLDRILDNPRA